MREQILPSIACLCNSALLDSVPSLNASSTSCVWELPRRPGQLHLWAHPTHRVSKSFVGTRVLPCPRQRKSQPSHCPTTFVFRRSQACPMAQTQCRTDSELDRPQSISIKGSTTEFAIRLCSCRMARCATRTEI